MSFLREAQICIANQTARKSLNAFISLAGRPTILRKAEAADTQRDGGTNRVHEANADES